MAFLQVRAKVVRDQRIDAVHAALEGVNRVNAGEVLRRDLHSECKKQRQDREGGHGGGGGNNSSGQEKKLEAFINIRERRHSLKVRWDQVLAK